MTLENIRPIALALEIIGLLVWVHWARTHSKHWLYALAPILWLLHVGVYYLAVIFGNLSPDVINLWSTAVRLHAIILAIGGGLVLMENHND